MKDSNIIIRIDDQLKVQFQELVKKNGFTVSNVLCACIRDITKKKKIPMYLMPYLVHPKKVSRVSIPDIKRSLEELIRNEETLGIQKAYLFGDFAKGSNTVKSKVDIRLEVADNFDKESIASLKEALKKKLNRNIEIFTSEDFTEEEIKNAKSEEICIFELA